LRDLTDLSIVIKGVLTAEDTEKCVQYVEEAERA
jgi:hypothetical protein